MVFCTDAAGHEDAWRWEVFCRFSWSYFAYILFYLPLVLHQPLPIIYGIFMLFSFLFLQPCCSIPFLLPCSSLVLHPFPTTGISSPPPYLSIGDRLLEVWLVEFLDAAVCRSPWGKSVLQQLWGWRGSFGKCRAANIHFTCWIHIPSILAAICFPLIK